MGTIGDRIPSKQTLGIVPHSLGFSRLLIEPFDIAAREDWERFI
jgi:hypothetical protein